jgi:hypothetical protein
MNDEIKYIYTRMLGDRKFKNVVVRPGKIVFHEDGEMALEFPTTDVVFVHSGAEIVTCQLFSATEEEDE